ncbi:MAG: hypothetical protein SGJ18_04005 [Pseudomonadota bacterium]|nr:hypothetical protein [Pseudomonadota bacterium]
MSRNNFKKQYSGNLSAANYHIDMAFKILESVSLGLNEHLISDNYTQIMSGKEKCNSLIQDLRDSNEKQ